MKKVISIISLLIILAIGVSACGTKAQDSSAQPANTGGQRQFARADLSGEVDSIIGNEITLKIVEMPNFRPNNGQENNGQQNGDQQNNGQQSNGRQNDDQRQRRPQGGDQPQGQRRPLNYTGETKTITIPADVHITTFTRGQNGGEAKTVELKDIKQGDVLQIWYSDKDKGTISRISVMSFRSNPS